MSKPRETSPKHKETTHLLRPGRTADTPRRRPKRHKARLYRYEDTDETTKTAGLLEKKALKLIDRTVNTMARPKDLEPYVSETNLSTESSMQRTPALPDPDAPEDGNVRVAGMLLPDFLEEMKQAEFKSNAQRRWMYANDPVMAEEFESKTPKGEDLPEKVARTVGAVMRGVETLAPDLQRQIQAEAEEWDVKRALQNLGLLKDAAKKKPYRSRVDVYALDKKNRLYSGLYPDGSIGLFGGGVDKGETVLQAGRREFKEEAGRKLENVKRLALPEFKEALLARRGWREAGKHDRAEQYGGTRTLSVVGDVVPGKKEKLTEPADHIKNVKFRTLEDAISKQKAAVKNSKRGHKGVLQHRLRALKNVQKMRKTADEMSSPVPPALLGGLLGGTAAYSLLPTAQTQKLRDAALKASTPQMERGLLDKALRANSRRLVGGAGAGLLGGFLLHKALEGDRGY